MITRRFIEKVHFAFDELRYCEKNILNFDKFFERATKTLTHSRHVKDAIETVNLFSFCLKKWNKIEKLFAKKLDVFNEYRYETGKQISNVSDELAIGTYFTTNGLYKKAKILSVASHSIDENLFSFSKRKGRFSIFADGKYYFKYAKASAKKLNIFNKNNKLVCKVILDTEDLSISLIKNNTNYELLCDNGFVEIYSKQYIDQLDDVDDANSEKRIADICWDALTKKSKSGVAQLSVYAENEDLELLLIFSMATFLLFCKYMKYLRKATGFFMLQHRNYMMNK